MNYTQQTSACSRCYVIQNPCKSIDRVKSSERSKNRNRAGCRLHRGREPHGHSDIYQWVARPGTANDTSDTSQLGTLPKGMNSSGQRVVITLLRRIL